jgi:MraZ protein
VGKSGKKITTFAKVIFNKHQLTPIIGTYECKIDAKGRVLVPASLKKQLPAISDGFVLKRSVFEPCLELWPMTEWNKMMAKINKLNPFDKKVDAFIRRFMAGVKTVDIDDAGRLLISKDLMGFAQMTKEIVFSSKVNIVEVWDKARYEATLESDDFDFGELAQEVMSNISFDE